MSSREDLALLMLRNGLGSVRILGTRSWRSVDSLPSMQASEFINRRPRLDARSGKELRRRESFQGPVKRTR